MFEATLAGANLRLRPTLMTVFAFILGTVPLAIATGSGAVSRRVLRITVIGGMLAATFISIFFIPASFYFVERFFVGKKKEEAAPRPEPADLRQLTLSLGFLSEPSLAQA